MTALTTTPNYDRMRQAIAECHSFDEVTEIRDKAVAMEAYYKQIRDEDAYWKFCEIRVRAIRRYGELVLSFVGPVDLKNKNWNTLYKELCAAMPDTAMKPRRYQDIMQPVRLASIPKNVYEAYLPEFIKSLTTTLKLFCDTVSHVDECPKQISNLTEEDVNAYRRLREERELEYLDRGVVHSGLIESFDEAEEEISKEVGYTLTRHDRKDMKQVVFIIKRPIHEEMRQAAFDNRCTMQEILRQGLDMWLNAHHRKPTETET